MERPLTGNLETLNLLRTKLYRPRLAGDLIRRPRVRELLNRSLDRSVTLVCAPAGFGKTTLLSRWLEECACPSAWLSLDEGDSDTAVFLSYFVAAVRTIFPDACADTLLLLRASQLPPLGPLVTTLANDLDRLRDAPALPAGQRFILILDDYHLVGAQAVHDLLAELLRHPPPTIHLILSTRQDPPLPLNMLRARGELGEIRMHDLRFSSDEAAAFMQQMLGTPLDADALAILQERTEGWAAGLRLAALTLSTSNDVAGHVTDLPADNRYVMDYLMSEVFSHIPVSTQEFLLKTSILERLSGPLCDALTGLFDPTWDGRAYLEWLAAANLFTFSLDAQGNWYRYHHLFRTLLRSRLERQLGGAEIAALHRRASGWYAERGLVEEAIEHALAAGDEAGAVQLVDAHRHAALNQEHWRQLEHWLRLMPRRLIDERPELLILEAWILQKWWRFADLARHLDRIEALMAQTLLPESDRTRMRSEIDALRSMLSYYVSDGERTFAFAQRALQTAPMECSSVRGLAWMYYAGGLQLKGDLRGALAGLLEGLKEDRFHGNAFPSRPFVGLCHLHWISADLPNLLQAAAQMLQVARERGLTESIAWARYFRGCALYHLDDLAGAESEFAAVVEQRYLVHSFAFSQSAFGLASVYQAQGASDRAREVAKSVATYALEINNARVLADAEAFQAYLAQEQGDPAAAQRWAASYDLKTPPPPLSTFHVPLVSRAKVLLAAGTPAGLAEASRTLVRLHEFAATTHNTRYLMEALALQALLHAAQNDRPAALATLARAVTLGEPDGMLRVFVDLGPAMAALLRQLATRGTTADYVRRLLRAFPAESPPQPAPSQPELIEPLSEREVEVLALLGERLSNKEIARTLNISPMTVKRHTVNIYQKLAVGSRREAVARAVALGLLTPSLPAYHHARALS